MFARPRDGEQAVEFVVVVKRDLGGGETAAVAADLMVRRGGPRSLVPSPNWCLCWSNLSWIVRRD